MANEPKRKRYSCFTIEQQEQFDGLSRAQQTYILLRAKGAERTEAYVAAGYSRSCAAQNAYHLERDNKVVVGLIEAMTAERKKLDVFKEETPVSKKVDKKADELPIELTADLVKVDEDAPMVKDEVPGKIEAITSEEAKQIQFYRQIANGTIKSVKTVKTYDKDGHLTGSREEVSSSIEDRVKAQKEVARILGIREVIDMGKIQANNINITIVDASRRDAKDDVRNKMTEVKDDGAGTDIS